jgi:hypothetical protein
VVARATAPTRSPGAPATRLIDDGDRHGRLIGALALDNRTGRQWARAALTLADRDLPEQPPGALAAERRLLRVGRPSAIGAGAQRIDLGLPARRLPLAPVLMFDPVGVALDRPGQRPIDEPGYGVGPWPTEVAVSVAPDLARLSDAPLPAGPLRMFRVDPAGELAWLGEGRWRCRPRARSAPRRSRSAARPTSPAAASARCSTSTTIASGWSRSSA